MPTERSLKAVQDNDMSEGRLYEYAEVTVIVVRGLLFSYRTKIFLRSHRLSPEAVSRLAEWFE
jgi:hypothetical protein